MNTISCLKPLLTSAGIALGVMGCGGFNPSSENEADTRHITPVSPIVAAAPAASLSEGLTAHWKLDEGSGTLAADASGQGHAATLQNSPLWDAGKIGGSLRFDGVNDYLDAGMHAFGLSGEMSAALWLKPASLPAWPPQVLIQRGQYVFPFMVRIDSNKIRACIRVASGTNYLSSKTLLSANHWYHVAFTFKSGEAILYINGQEESRASVLGPMSVSAGEKTTIGANALGQNPFNGHLDDLRVYNRVLSPEEITYLSKLDQEMPPPQTNPDRESILALITGNRYYLDAEKGDDTSGQGTSNLPWKTLAKARAVVKSGDGVFLRSGNYGSYIENSAGRSSWVVYINDEGHTPVLTDISSRFNSPRSVYMAFYGISILPAWVDPSGDAAWQAAHPGSTDPQYSQSGTGTYRKTVNPVNTLFSDHLKFVNCEITGTNKHLTSDGCYITNCNDVLIKGCHIQGVSRGILYQGGTGIQALNNHIQNITSTFICSGVSNRDVLIEGNNCYDSNWSMKEDWCPRAAGQTYHASFVSIRSSDVTIRNNIFHNGGTSSTFMTYNDTGCPGAYHNILIENNLVYDPQNQTGLRLYRIGSNIVVRNNILVGRQRYDAQPGPVQYGTVFSLSEVAAGHDGSGLSVYNNVFVGMVSYGQWYSTVHEANNICWSVLTIPGGVWRFLTQADLRTGSKVITSRTGTAPDYFTNGFFNGPMDFSWTSEGTDYIIPHGHGKVLDFTYAPASEARNFGNPLYQPADSLGTLSAYGFLKNTGKARNQSAHSAGCYEP